MNYYNKWKLNYKKNGWIVFCLLIFGLSFASYVSGAYEDTQIEKIKEEQKSIRIEQKKETDNTKKTAFSQNKDIPGIVLVCTGKNSNNAIKSEAIHNIFLVIFEKNNKSGRVNLVGLQKEACVGKKGEKLIKLKDTFDRERPQKMYDAIYKTTGFKVSSYFSYNNDTVKNVMDILYVLNVTAVQYKPYNTDDVPLINAQIDSFADHYGIANRKKIKFAGNQPMLCTQILSYVNLYYDEWECINNDWRQLNCINEIITCIKNGSYFELQKIKNCLIKGDNNYDKEAMVSAVAAIKEYKEGFLARWPDFWMIKRFKDINYIFPDKVEKNAKSLHKVKLKERGYEIPKIISLYANELAKIVDYIDSYNKRQIEKKEIDERSERKDNANANVNVKNNNKPNVKSKNKQNKINNNNNSNNKKVVSEPESQPEPETETNPQVTPEPDVTDEQNSEENNNEIE